jgi:hypothetical protein
MADRRESLKIIGAIGTTCAFPFSADELYGQHADHSPGKPATMPSPSFFSKAEMEKIAKIADLIIPATDTPGAVAAGVPAYIDFVCSRNARLAKTIRDGLTSTAAVDEAALRELDRTKSPFFQAIKSVTADGYYTSKTGLIDELGYRGNTVLADFPSCEED